MEDYEKKYKESLERAREYKNGEIEHDLEIGENIMDYVFPELKDSKDERIRKAIINVFATHKDYEIFYGVSVEDILAWLEKQAEHANFRNKIQVGDRVTRNEDGVLVNLSQLDRVTKQDKNNMGISEATKQELKDNLDKALEKETPESWNEFLDEQKPVDKVELKFHEGDWVVFNNNHQSIYQVEKIEDEYYILRHTHGGTFRVCILHDESLRLWDITKDVKACDILAADPIEGIEGFSFSSSFVAIYKKRNGEDFDSYCFVGFDGKFCKGTTGHSTDNIHPATKEQRETLFKVMRKAGYEWDAEHKQLNKIEQKSVRSKEDIKILERIICILDSIRYYNTVDNKQEIPYQLEIDFLKSLKDRYSWKPSKEQINTLFKYAEQNNKDGSILTSLYQELKKLKE